MVRRVLKASKLAMSEMGTVGLKVAGDMVSLLTAPTTCEAFLEMRLCQAEIAADG